MDSNTTSQTNNQENLDNSNVGETEEEVEVEDQHVPGFSSQQLCEAVFRTLEIHGKPQALKGSKNYIYIYIPFQPTSEGCMCPRNVP